MALSSVVFFEPAPHDLLLIAALAVGIIFAFLKYVSSLKSAFILLWIFVIGNLISLSNAADEHRGIYFLLITLYLVVAWLFFTGVFNYYGKPALEIMFSGYLTAAVISALVGIASFFNLLPAFDAFVSQGRITGLFKDPNVFGPFLTPAALYLLMKLEGAAKLGHRILWAGFMCVISLGVLLSYSRAAWGSYALVVLLHFMIPRARGAQRRGFYAVTVLAMIVLIILQSINMPEIGGLFNHRFGLQGYDIDRFSTQEAAWNQFLAAPLGIGSGQSEIFFDYATHNLYLRVLVENGIISFAAFIGFVFLSLRRAFHKAFKASGPLQGYYRLSALAIIGILFNSLVIDSLHWRHFWFLLAIPWMQSAEVEQKPELT